MKIQIKFPPPSEKQTQFLMDRHKHIGYGGAWGGGKSHAVRMKAVGLGFRYPGIKLAIVRRTYPELMRNHVEPLKKILNVGYPDKNKRAAVYNKTERVMTLLNGSTISFMYCDNERQLERFQGLEIDVLFIDEATQYDELWLQKMVACVRGVNGFPKRVYYTCNPGGRGHAYIKRIFIDRRYKTGENPEEYSFIRALVTDNKALMETNPDYKRQLEALPPKLRKAWLEGDWNIFEGQFFEEFLEEPSETVAEECGLSVEELKRQRRWTHVIEPFDIPKQWTVFRSFDWGYSKPFSCAWWAVDFEGCMYRILELYGCTQTPNEGVKWEPNKVFDKIHEVETTHPWLAGRNIGGVADPAIWDSSTGVSIEEVAAKHRVYFSKADNARIPGWMQMHYRLAFDEDGYPMLYVFSNCKAFIRTIPLLVYDDVKVEDLDTDMEDHVADESRYACMSRPISPRVPPEAEVIEDDPLNMIADAKKRRR